MNPRILFLLVLFCVTNRAAEPTVLRDITYAKVNDKNLALDLHLSGEQRGPLIVYVHGGAWRSGSKKEMPLADLVANGIPVATIDYRLSTEARFPAQAHDIKAAIRFLRGNEKKLGINASKIIVSGSSAGGHLAALIGVTNGDKQLEGELGDFRDQSSAVQGIISFFGGSDLTTILSQSTPKALEMRVPALELLLGDHPDKVPDLAKLASPVYHVDKSDPPLLLFHGDRDPQMPVNQALQLEGAYEAAGLKVRLKILHGSGHGGKAFYDVEAMALVKEWLRTIP
jgi:acetyl esterase/lipase